MKDVSYVTHTLAVTFTAGVVVAATALHPVTLLAVLSAVLLWQGLLLIGGHTLLNESKFVDFLTVRGTQYKVFRNFSKEQSTIVPYRNAIVVAAPTEPLYEAFLARQVGRLLDETGTRTAALAHWLLPASYTALAVVVAFSGWWALVAAVASCVAWFVGAVVLADWSGDDHNHTDAARLLATLLVGLLAAGPAGFVLASVSVGTELILAFTRREHELAADRYAASAGQGKIIADHIPPADDGALAWAGFSPPSCERRSALTEQ